MQSLVASAQRLTKKKLTGGSFKKTTAQGWQEDAWEMYDLVGEQHFLGSTLANQASKARFYVGVLGEGADTTDMPEPSTDPRLQGIIERVGGGPVGFSQMIQRMVINLFVAGDGWLVGIPKQLLPDYEPGDEVEEAHLDEWDPRAILDPEESEELSMDDLEWRMMSVSEVSMKREGTVVLHLGAEASEKLEVDPDLLFMIRVWRPHPRRWWEADSPTRASLPVLRELVGLTMHISAQVDSRLAGAGLLLVPASAARALKIAAGIPEDSPEDPFTDALIEAMLTPIGDRANASALVPLVVTIPDGTAQDFQYLTFSKPLDTEARNLRDEAIRRLALSQDAPPELLLGTGGMNHWGAWLVRDDVVSTHLEPPLALVADAMTTQYLRPMMLEMGFTKEEASQYVVWYDTSKMVVQPNRASDALTLYDRDALSDEALREANGFDESDAPETSKMDLASQKAFLMVQENPGLMANPGLPALVEQLRSLLAGNPVPLPKKGNASQVAAEPGQSPAPVDENGRPIPTSNPSIAPSNAPASAEPAPATRAPQAPAGTGTPPRNPSVKQGPALAAGTSTLSKVSNEEYARQLPGGGWELSDKALEDVMRESFGSKPITQQIADEMREGDSEEDPFVKGFLEEADRQKVRDEKLADQSDLTEAPSIGQQPHEIIVEDQVDEKPAMRGAIVVLIPEPSDPIHKFSKDVDAHLTLAYLAQDIDEEAMPPLEGLLSQAARAAEAFSLSSLALSKDKVMPLGDAVVVTLHPNDGLHDIYSRLTNPVTPIGKLNEARNAYEFRPHVSLEYIDDDRDVAEVAQNYVFPFYGVKFDRIGVWIGDEHYDFPLGEPVTVSFTESPSEPAAPSDEDDEAVEFRATEEFMGQPVMNPEFSHKIDRVPESATVVRSLAEVRQTELSQNNE